MCDGKSQQELSDGDEGTSAFLQWHTIVLQGDPALTFLNRDSLFW